MFRIQKILLAEFEEIYEPLLVENPFTLVDEHGNGLRQCYIGLTQEKLLFGCDIIEEVCNVNCYAGGLDPAIESFELMSLLPLEFVRVHFYRKHGRELMHLSLHGVDQPVWLFEFGGHLYKSLFWNTWRDCIASIGLEQPRLRYITQASPYSSTDVILDDEVHTAIVHTRPAYAVSHNVCISVSGSLN